MQPTAERCRLRLGWLSPGLLVIALWASSAQGGEPTSADLSDMSLEQLMTVRVYTASRHAQSSSEAPSSVTVITAEEIRRFGWRTLADILRSTRGFFATYDRTYSYIGVRGLALPGDQNTKVLFLVDGHRVNDDIYNQGYVGEDFILDLDLVDRVEIVRGPTSSLYGSNAFFGVVNVVTRRGSDIGGLEAAVDAGSQRTCRGRLTYGRRFAGGTDVLLSGSLYSRSGNDLYFPEFDSPETNTGCAAGLDGERTAKFFGVLSLNDVMIEAGYVSRHKDVPTSSYGAIFPDPTNRSVDDMLFAEAKLDRLLAGTSTFLRLYYDWYRFYGQNTIEDAEVEPAYPHMFLLKDSAEDRGAGAEAKLSRTLFERHSVTIGGEYKRVSELKQHTYADSPPLTALETDRPARFWALFAQTESQLPAGFLVNAGLRHDHYSTFGGTTNPRVAVIWIPAARTSFKLLYGRAFRAPNAYELYWNDGGLTQKGNPNLKPERICTSEAVWEQALGSGLRSTISGYSSEIANLLSAVTDPADGLDMFVNVGGVTAKGVEFELEGAWRSGLECHLSYCYQHGRDKGTGDELQNFPRHNAKAGVAAPLVPRKLLAALEMQYLSRRLPAAPTHATDAPAFAVVNTTILWCQALPGLDASVSAYNLFDKSYSDLGGTEHEQELLRQDGRSFRFKLARSF